LCETKPICEDAEGSPLRHRDHRDDPKPMTEMIPTSSPCTPSLCGEDSCETNPIRPGPHEGQVLFGERVMTNWSCRGLRQGEANLRHRAVVQNKANWGVCRAHPGEMGDSVRKTH
jgi:hypothetical protein